MGPTPAILSLVVLLALLPSCSIKADRTDCPCRLEIVTDDGEVTVVLWRKGCVFSEISLDSCEREGGRFFADIEKGKYVVTVNRGSYAVERGSQSDSLYVWSSMDELNAVSENLVVEPCLHKQFACLDVLVKERAGIKVSDVEIKGAVCGLSMNTLEPLPGVFEYHMELSADCVWVGRIPRQQAAGGDLSLVVGTQNGDDFIFDLSGCLNSMGYDWSLQDLPDVEVWVDLEECSLAVGVARWDTGFDNCIVL